MIDAANLHELVSSLSGGSAHLIEPPFRVATTKLWRDDGLTVGHSDEEAAMCLRAGYDLYARTSSKPVRSKPARSLVEVLRDLFRPPRTPQEEQAEVVPLRTGVATRSDKEAVREPSKAA